VWSRGAPTCSTITPSHLNTCSSTPLNRKRIMSVSVAVASHETEREAPHYLRGKMIKQVNQGKQGKQVRMMRVHTDKTQKCMLHTSA